MKNGDPTSLVSFDETRQTFRPFAVLTNEGDVQPPFAQNTLNYPNLSSVLKGFSITLHYIHKTIISTVNLDTLENIPRGLWLIYNFRLQQYTFILITKVRKMHAPLSTSRPILYYPSGETSRQPTPGPNRQLESGIHRFYLLRQLTTPSSKTLR